MVLKPAEQSPGCALALVEALHEAGVPPDALALLPGDGEAGAALVRDPRVHVIAFTGSGAVGLEIVRAAAETPDGQGHVKRVVAEMGGKNCVIVDSDADLDEAVPGIVALGLRLRGPEVLGGRAGARARGGRRHAGRAARRGGRACLIVGQAERVRHRRAAGDRARGAGAGAALRRAGRAAGPHRRAPGRGAGRGLVLPADGRGRDLPPDSAVLSEEVFGPLLAVERVAQRGGGLRRASTRCRSRSPAGCSRAARPRSRTWRAARPVGNLYVNRDITGAMVGRQPFGGNRRSGIGSKAGGPDYLLQFAEPRVVTENTMRHGLVVD